MFPLFLGRVFGLALLLIGINYSILGKPYFNSYVVDFLAGSVTSFWLLLVDTIYIYPRYRSPLRNLPLVAVSQEEVRQRQAC